jgi:hypothetical protein
MTLEFAERKLSTKNRRKDNTSADAELLAAVGHARHRQPFSPAGWR